MTKLADQVENALNETRMLILGAQVLLGFQFQGAFQPGQEPSPELRAWMDSARAQMQEFQTEADKWVASIRANLTTDQQAEFDSLPKPQLTRRPGSTGGGPTRP